MNLGELLNTKDFKHRAAITVGESEAISAAIQKLVEHDRGSLPVCNDKGELVGIITERDIVRKCFRNIAAFAETRVRDIMTTQVVVGKAEDDLDYALNAMQQHRIRHIPIVEGRKVIGMISMRDLVGVQLKECRTQVHFLSDYLAGGSLS